MALASLGAASAATLAVLWHLFPFPVDRLDQWPVSAIVLDREGHEILEVTASDGQRRRAVPLSEISPWIVKATLAIEDKRFYHHLGVDPLAATRAAGQLLTQGRVISGASTITMQVCRMMDDRPRSLAAKAVESFRALQLEHIRSKDQILELYLNTAPYGRNLRGVEAASRYYFGRCSSDLSLEQAATLAGLPQSPSRLRPDRYPDLARERRNRVLQRMFDTGMISADGLAAAVHEPLTLSVQAPPPPSQVAFEAIRRRPAGTTTTIDSRVQRLVERTAAEHVAGLPADTNAAVVVIDVESGDVLAMVGSMDYFAPDSGQVNGAVALRSPGSALKPFFYAAAFDDARLSPESMLEDAPIQRGNWKPQNFSQCFVGPVTAADALRRSLNVPAILVSEGLGLPRCKAALLACGVEPRGIDRSGLALTVGAVEVRLIDLTNAYAVFARRGRMKPWRLFPDERTQETIAFGPSTASAINDILSTRRRRPHGIDNIPDSDLPWFMWKTGTSAGRTDAWAVGHNGKYAVGVWVGRFAGQSSRTFVGSLAPEPILARLFCSDELRTSIEPAPTPHLTVTRNLPDSREQAAVLTVLSPAMGTEYFTLGGSALVPVKANHPVAYWFADGQLIAPDRDRVQLTPGTHVLRAVDRAGKSDSVRITVR